MAEVLCKPILLENGHCLLIPMSASSSVYPLLHPMCFPARRALLKALRSRGWTCKDHSRHDFILEKRKKLSDKFYYIAISDPQVKNEHDMKRWKQESIRDLKGYVDTLSRERGSGQYLGRFSIWQYEPVWWICRLIWWHQNDYLPMYRQSWFRQALSGFA